MLRDGDTGDWVGTFQGHKGAVWSVSLNREATKAATAGADFTARLWDATTGDQLLELTEGHVVKTVKLSQHDDRLLLTGGNERRLRLYDVNAPDRPTVSDKL